MPTPSHSVLFHLPFSSFTPSVTRFQRNFTLPSSNSSSNSSSSSSSSSSYSQSYNSSLANQFSNSSEDASLTSFRQENHILLVLAHLAKQFYSKKIQDKLNTNSTSKDHVNPEDETQMHNSSSSSSSSSSSTDLSSYSSFSNALSSTHTVFPYALQLSPILLRPRTLPAPPSNAATRLIEDTLHIKLYRRYSPRFIAAAHKTMFTFYNAVIKQESAAPFTIPVDEKTYPDYYLMISNPVGVYIF